MQTANHLSSKPPAAKTQTNIKVHKYSQNTNEVRAVPEIQQCLGLFLFRTTTETELYWKKVSNGETVRTREKSTFLLILPKSCCLSKKDFEITVN